MPSLITLALLAALQLACAPVLAADDKGPRRPTLTLRATPRIAFSPVTVFFTAELVGGDDIEELYCPDIVWEWGDGGKSEQGSDCAPFEEGVSKIERRFSTEHRYKRAGNYTVSATLRRTGKAVTRAEVKLTIRPGFGDPRR